MKQSEFWDAAIELNVGVFAAAGFEALNLSIKANGFYDQRGSDV